MTGTPKPDDQQQESSQQSLSLLADRKELLRLRLLPVELAKVLNVTKQTISVWIRDGKISPPSPIDGRLDAQAAVRQILRNTPPGKIRARILRQAIEDAQELRDNLVRAESRAARAEEELANERAVIEHLNGWIATGERSLAIFLALIVEHADALRARPPEDWPRHLDDLVARADEEAEGGGDGE